MTALGKTLVFFNLLFALVTGGLIVNAFVTRTNWKLGMDQAVQEMKAAQAALRAEQASAATRKSEAESQIKKLQEQITKLDNDIKGKDAEIANEKKRKSEVDTESAKAAAISNAASAEIERLQRERNQMADQQRLLNDQLVKVTKDFAEATNRETYFKLRSEALEKDLAMTREELVTVKRKYEQLLARMPSGRANEGAEENPRRVPSIETSGKVTGVSGNLVEISIGSDNRIERGHILQVYRTTPNPLFLGTLTITHTRAHEAVGTFEPANPGRMVAKGDSVDTKIIR